MDEAELRETIAGIGFLVTAALVVAIFFRMVARVIRHHTLGEGTMPRALARDLVLFAGLMVLILVPALSTALGIVIGTHTWWVILRTIIGVFVLGVFAYYEFAVVGRAEVRD